MDREYRVAMLSLETGDRLECHTWHYAPFFDDCDAAARVP